MYGYQGQHYRGLTIVMGGPRSGTTWLAKIFDSHPDVLYRHEPDLVHIHDRVPHICPETADAELAALTRQYMLELVGLRVLKTVGSLPLFAKSYEGTAPRLLRHAMLVGLRAALALAPARAVNRVTVPEFIPNARQPDLHVVIKTVASLGRAGLLAQALPEARFVLIQRNPFGQIASRLRGEKSGRLEPRPRDLELLGTRQAATLGLTRNVLETSSEVEYLAWEWAILNQKALDELEGRANVMVLRHRDLVADPIGRARAIFTFAGLDWRETCADFVARSSTHDGREGYFQVMRDAKSTVDNWRTALDPEQQRQIAAVIRRTKLAARWPEIFASPQYADADTDAAA